MKRCWVLGRRWFIVDGSRAVGVWGNPHTPPKGNPGNRQIPKENLRSTLGTVKIVKIHRGSQKCVTVAKFKGAEGTAKTGQNRECERWVPKENPSNRQKPSKPTNSQRRTHRTAKNRQNKIHHASRTPTSPCRNSRSWDAHRRSCFVGTPLLLSHIFCPSSHFNPTKR